MKKYLIGGAAIALCMAGNAQAAANLTSVAVTGPSGTVWNTAKDSFYAVFLAQPIGTVHNANDDFTSDPTELGANNFAIFGDGWPRDTTANSDPIYTITLGFADGATISGQYIASTFANGTSATVGGTTYSMTGFGWDRSRADNVSGYTAVSGGDNSDYTGQFSFTATAVPEPATWAMMLVGFAMVGGVARYRSRKSSVVFS